MALPKMVEIGFYETSVAVNKFRFIHSTKSKNRSSQVLRASLPVHSLKETDHSKKPIAATSNEWKTPAMMFLTLNGYISLLAA